VRFIRWLGFAVWLYRCHLLFFHIQKIFFTSLWQS
jgi:hypothetical protein